MAPRDGSTAQPPTSDAPFKYVGGEPALDFVNTVDWTSRGPERDRLTSYDRLVEWAIDAGVFSRETGETVRAASRRSPKRRDAALDSAVRLRAVLRRVLRAIATGERDDAALTHFDAYVERALAQRAIVRETTRRGARRGSSHLDWG